MGPMIHYHGTPITPRSELQKLAGRHFCVSFASPQDIKVVHEIGQSVMLDNGAFSTWRRGIEIDWNDYYEWCAPWLEYQTTWAVIPDVIDGTEEENDALIRQWPHGDRGAPVWHVHESFNRLLYLLEAWPRICIGSSGQYANVGTAAWCHRMDDAFDVIAPTGMVYNWIHMLRGLSLSGSHYPFASVDSAYVGRNHHRDGGVELLVGHWDGRQCPRRWVRPAKQMELPCTG